MKYISSVASVVMLAVIISCNGPSTTTLPGSWDKIGDFPGFPRSGAVCFVINDTVYMGTGFNYQLSSNPVTLGYNNSFGRLSDFWKYDPSTDSWVQKASMGDSTGTLTAMGANSPKNLGVWARSNAVGFSINNYGYVCTGSPDGGTTLLSDCWQFDPTAGKWGKWTRVADFAGGSAQPLGPRYSALAFTVQDKSSEQRGFVGGGTTFGKMNLKDFWEFVPGDGSRLSGSWAQQPDMGGSKRANAFVMIINGVAYVGGGSDNGTFVTDFFKFDVSLLESGGSPWVAMNGLTGKDVNGNAITQPRPRELASAFGIGNYGYLTCGSTGGPNGDTWQYNPSNDTWVQYFSITTNQPIAGASRMGAIGFAVGNFGYLTTGESARTSQYDDAWKFNPIGVEQDNK